MCYVLWNYIYRVPNSVYLLKKIYYQNPKVSNKLIQSALSISSDVFFWWHFHKAENKENFTVPVNRHRIKHNTGGAIVADVFLSSSQTHKVLCWTTWYKTDMDRLKQAQQKTTEVIKAGTLAPWEPDLFSLGKKRLGEDVRAAPQYLQGSCWENGGRFFTEMCGSRMRSNGYEMKQDSEWISENSFFMVRTVEYWKSLPREVVLSPSWDVFKMKLNKALSYLICCHSWTCCEQDVGLKPAYGPFQPQLFHDLLFYVYLWYQWDFKQCNCSIRSFCKHRLPSTYT